MNNHIALACNDVFDDSTDSHFSCSLDDFYESCRGVIVKKNTTSTTSFCTPLILVLCAIRVLCDLIFFKSYF